MPRAPNAPQAITDIIDAIKARDFVLAEQLITVTPGITDRYDDSESGLLFEAILAKKLRLCELLIERGASVHARNDYNDTPLHFAAYHAPNEICELLLRSGADLHAIGYEDSTPMHHAAAAGSVELLRLFVANGGDVGFVPERAPTDWVTPFQAAVRAGLLKAVFETIPYMVEELGQSPLQATVAGVSMVDLAHFVEVRELMCSLIAQSAVGAEMVGECSGKGCCTVTQAHLSPL